eukprot:365756-Chlamydomonas_euryale.AAC.13
MPGCERCKRPAQACRRTLQLPPHRARARDCASHTRAAAARCGRRRGIAVALFQPCVADRGDVAATPPAQPDRTRASDASRAHRASATSARRRHAAARRGTCGGERRTARGAAARRGGPHDRGGCGSSIGNPVRSPAHHAVGDNSCYAFRGRLDAARQQQRLRRRRLVPCDADDGSCAADGCDGCRKHIGRHACPATRRVVGRVAAALSADRGSRRRRRLHSHDSAVLRKCGCAAWRGGSGGGDGRPSERPQHVHAVLHPRYGQVHARMPACTHAGMRASMEACMADT